MKKILLLFLVPCFAIANDYELITKKVTVFLAGAQISAQAKIQLKEGNNEILFSDLSPNINANSIQVRGLNKASINSIQFDVTFLQQQKISAELKDLKNQIELLKDQISLKESRISGLESEESVMIQNKKLNSNEANSSLTQLKNYAAYYRQRSEEINNQLYLLKKERDELQKEIGSIQREINKLEGRNRKSRGQIKLVLNSEISQSSSLEITYLVNDAGWNPSYELRAKNTKSPVDFLYQANIYQNTGDDWKDVDLTLSTADPTQRGQKPTLLPYFLNFYSPQKYKEANTYSVNDHMDAETALEEQVQGTKVSIRGMASADSNANKRVKKIEQLSVMSFQLPKKYSIQSNEEALKVKLDQQNLEAEFEYYVAPVLDPTVYLTCTLKDWQTLDLLPGEASIYFEDTYVSVIFIDANASADEFLISLGSDQNIVAERKQVNKMKSKSFFRSNQIVEKEFEISLRNNKNTNIEVKLEDRLPISQNSDIKVSDETYDGAKLEKDTGILTWEVQLDAKAKKTHKFSYKVTFPKGERVNLER